MGWTTKEQGFNFWQEYRFISSKEPSIALGPTKLPILCKMESFPWSYSRWGEKLRINLSVAEVTNEWRYLTYMCFLL
jgi:hypothetical protein